LSTGYVTVPTADLRSGNFAGLNAFVDSNGNPTTVNGPYWAQVLSQRLGYTVTNGEPYSLANCTSTSNCVFPVGLIPQRGFAPTAIPLMKYIPLPNTGSDTFTTAGQNLTLNNDKAGQRVDVLDDKKTGNWYMYYSFDDSTTKNPFGFSRLNTGPSDKTRQREEGGYEPRCIDYDAGLAMETAVRKME